MKKIFKNKGKRRQLVKVFLVLLLLLSLSVPFFLRITKANLLGGTYLFFERNQIDLGADMYLLLNPSLDFNDVGEDRVLKITFSGALGDWCKANGALNVSGVTGSAVDFADWTISSVLPGTLTATCNQSSSGDYIEVEGIGTLDAGVGYGLFIEKDPLVFKNANTAGNHLVTVQLIQGLQTESASFEISLVTDDQVSVVVEVSESDTISCTLSATTVDLGTLYKGGAYATNGMTLTTDSTSGFYWVVYGEGNGTIPGLYTTAGGGSLLSSVGVDGKVNLLTSEGFGMLVSTTEGSVVYNYTLATLGVFGAIGRGIDEATLFLLANTPESVVTTNVYFGARAGNEAVSGSYQETLTYVCGGYIGEGEPATAEAIIYDGQVYGNEFFQGTVSLSFAPQHIDEGDLNTETCEVNINEVGWTEVGVTSLLGSCRYNAYTPDADFNIAFRIQENLGNWIQSRRNQYVYDIVAPSGGSVSNNNGTQFSTVVIVAVDKGTDLKSGLSYVDSDYLLEVSSASVTGGACGTFGAYQDAGVGEEASATTYYFSGLVENCYKFRYTVKDNIGNETTYTGTNITQIETFSATGARVGPPTSIAVLGDSISAGTGTQGFAGSTQPQNSWATGTAASLGSVYQRIYALDPAIDGNNYNFAQNGKQMVDIQTQAGLLPTNVEYVLIQIGGNDLCRSNINQMTPVETYRQQFITGLNAIAQRAPNALILVNSVPDIYNLWYLRGAPNPPNPNTSPYVSSARFFWNYTFNLFPCQSLLDNASSYPGADEDRRQLVREQNIDLNEVLSQECSQTLRCRFDEWATFNFSSNREVPPYGSYLPYGEFTFLDADISTIDHFHPAFSGQQKLAEEAWVAGYDFTDSVAPAISLEMTGVANPTAAFISISATDNIGVRGIEFRIHSPVSGTSQWYQEVGSSVVVTAGIGSVVEARALDINGNVSASSSFDVQPF